MTSNGRVGAGLVLALALASPASGNEPTVEVVVCSSHHHVLRHWLRVAEQGGLPRSGVTVVHLDGHPDLGVPGNPVAGQWPERAEQLVGAVDIASFQLAAVRVGLVDRIVWLRPAFAHQLADGERRFRLGVLASGELRVDDPSDYYVLDQGWAPRSELREPTDVSLRVIPVEAATEGGPLAEGPTILDIDLDAFATRNPSADYLRESGLTDDQLAALRRIFAPDNLDLAADPELRIRQLDGMLAAVEQLASGPWTAWPGGLFTLFRSGIAPLELYELYSILASLSGETATTALLEHGRQLVGVPEHREVSPADIAAQAEVLRALLSSGSVRPSLVTIARSVDDGFTPQAPWPRIEWAVLRVLAESLPHARLRFDHGLGPAPQPEPRPTPHGGSG
jgi:hypothetical protein